MAGYLYMSGILVTCPTCKGKGYYQCYGCGGNGRYNCNMCGGKGHLSCSTCGGSGGPTVSNSITKDAGECPSCKGSGTYQEECEICHGEGRIKVES